MSQRFIHALVLLVLVIASDGCASSSRCVMTPPAANPQADNVTDWLAQHPLPPDQEMEVVELGRTESSSWHIVQIRHREALHVHQSHDLVVVLQWGRGMLQRGAEWLPMSPGSVVAVPRGVPHAFANESARPAAALVVFTPPYDGTDTVPVNE